MKKLFLFLAVTALTLTSCSKDDDNNVVGNSITLKVDGTSKSFGNITAAEAFGFVVITGYNGPAEDPTESITISIESGETGNVANITYYDENDDYFGDLTTNVTTNTTGTAIGTFSGTLEGFDSPNITITEGSFDVKY